MDGSGVYIPFLPTDSLHDSPTPTHLASPASAATGPKNGRRFGPPGPLPPCKKNTPLPREEMEQVRL